MGKGQKLALLAGAVVAATAAGAQPAKKATPKPAAAAGPASSGGGAQVVTGPVAVYWMSAATQSGFGMPGAGGGGGRPSMSQIMQMMNGGGGANHSLTLQLGSSQAPTGEPQAEHDPPAGLGLGASVPLVTPEKVQAVHEETDRPEIPREYQKPKGKMLIFWGCGEHAKPGQPVVIDFAQMTPEKMTSGQMPAGFAAFQHMITSRMQPPSPSRNRTYGDWPNSKSRVSVTGQSSLVGDHLVKGDYSPEIRFSLDQNQDFLGPLTLTTNAKTPSGSVQLAWNAVPNAEAYLASFIGAGGDRDDPTMVMWISSETEAIGFAVPEYISNPEIARLVRSQTLMGPSVTSCQVPKEAVDAGKQGLLQMVAYGHEANFSYPPRPTNPKTPWNIAWEVKVRYRSATGGLLGQPMPGMGGGGAGGRGGQQTRDQPPPSPADAAAARRRAILNGIGGLIPH